ncbi:vacuolar sorting protein VPS1 [Xylaria intraflava]|nr:vacuolar sorting protein VPS1 [Xylaria intraflava]
MSSTPGGRSSTPISQPGDAKDNNEDAASRETISENPFDSESSRVLFDAVDQLQHCGAGRHIEIPQLVIVGGQSTGKSSLLQSLTDIPFPVGSGCCTRFATRIVSRRTAPGTANRFKITIVDPEVEVEGFEYAASRDYDEYVHVGETLGADEFKDVMDEVSDNYMGIKSGKGPDRKNFATQVLRVELSGPGRSYFSIVDIPGLFVNPDTVNEGEMHGIRNMIIEYMKKPENFVICVADAVTDLANQGIVHLASQHVDRDRCVGVLTKCDMLRDDEEASSKVVGIATSGEDHTAKPICDAWFVVRNRSSKEDKSFDLAEAEKKLFEKAPWNEIPHDRRGTTMLRTHLSNLLSRRIRGNFPSIRIRIHELLTEAQKSRAALGDPRLTPFDRRLYLRNIIEKYEALATQALEKPGLLRGDLRARNKVKAANDEFARLMRTEGYKYQFEDPDIDPLSEVRKMMAERDGESEEESGEEEDEEEEEASPPLRNNNSQYFFSASATSKSPAFPTPSPRRTASKKTDSKPDSKPKPKTRSVPSPQPAVKTDAGVALREHIQAELLAFEGTHLPGLVNPEVMPALFQTQTEKWRDHAAAHVNTVSTHIGIIAKDLLVLVCPPTPAGETTRLYDGLFRILGTLWEEATAAALSDVDRFCLQERSHMLQTTDPRFNERLKAWQTIRLLRSLDTVSLDSNVTAIYDRIHFSIETNMVNAVHDILKVYYQIAIESFVRHVTNHIIEGFVSGCSKNHPKGPLRGLTRDWVYSLSDDEVADLAREDDETIAKRARLDEKIRELHTADVIAQRATEATSNLGRVRT